MFKRVGGCALRYSRATPARSRHLYRRKFSTSPSSAAASPSPSAPFGGLTVELDRVTPRFEVDASQIKILDSPSAFYDAIKVSFWLASVSWIPYFFFFFTKRNS